MDKVTIIRTNRRGFLAHLAFPLQRLHLKREFYSCPRAGRNGRRETLPFDFPCKKLEAPDKQAVRVRMEPVEWRTFGLNALHRSESKMRERAQKRSLRIAVLITAMALLSLASVQAVPADSADFPGALPIITGEGLTIGDDTPAQTFIVPGAGSVDIKFTLTVEECDFLFSFGYYDVGAVTATFPTDNAGLEACMTDAIMNHGVLIFGEHSGGNTDGDMVTLPIDAGTEIGFFLIPNDSLANFNLAPVSYFLESNWGYTSLSDDPTFTQVHQPLSLQEAANFDGTDHY